MNRNKRIGLLAVLGIWLSAGLAFPYVNVLAMFTPPQLMAFRGLITAACAIVLLKGKVQPRQVDRYTWLATATLPFATYGLFMGSRHGGAAATTIILTATPAVNFMISLVMGKSVSRQAWISLGVMLGGVTLARWGSPINLDGLIWAGFGTVLNGILYEWFARAKSPPLVKCFWTTLSMGIFGLSLSTSADWSPLGDPTIGITTVIFALVAGLLYWLANLVAFERLPKNELSVLAQGETPMVLIGAYCLLGEQLSPLQWLGVLIALYGAWKLLKQL